MNKPVALPAQLHACVNDFLSQANEMQKSQPYDAISASILYAAARYNVHGYVQQGDDRNFSRADFVAYMTDLYRRMLEEQIDVLGAAAEGSAT
jgi:predicted SnoaL-like aldol condensation-catalyzing enzyme